MARASTAAAVTAVRRRASTAATWRSIGCRPAKARPGRPRRVASARAGEREHEPEGLGRRCVADGPSRLPVRQQRHCQRDRQAGEWGQAPPPRGPGDREHRADRDDDLRARPAWSQPLGRNGRPHVDVHGAPAPRALEHGAPRRPRGAIVVNHGPGAADDGAAGGVHPQPELDVVAAEAMRPVLAEPAELPQDPAPVGDVGARAPVDLRIARGEDEAVAEAGRLRRSPRCAARPRERHQPQHRRHRAAVRCARARGVLRRARRAGAHRPRSRSRRTAPPHHGRGGRRDCASCARRCRRAGGVRRAPAPRPRSVVRRRRCCCRRGRRRLRPLRVRTPRRPWTRLARRRPTSSQRPCVGVTTVIATGRSSPLTSTTAAAGSSGLALRWRRQPHHTPRP